MSKTLLRPKVLVDCNDLMINDNTLQWSSRFSKEGGSVITIAAYARPGTAETAAAWTIIQYTADSSGDIVAGKHANGKFDMLNVYDNGDQNIIAGATAADPGVITYTSANYTGGDLDAVADGDIIEITGVAGMVELNTNFYLINNINTGAKTFEIQTLAGVDVDTTAFTAYTSGGVMHKRTFSNYTFS
ncbi:hypothetical protein OAF54_02065 [bacterium]|nr:hypothetical protein [bacterium]